VDIAVKRDVMILSDEIYDRFIFDDFQHLSPAAVPGGKERTLVLNALSKTYAMTGWRVGWVAGPADLMAQVKQLKASVSGPNSVVAQYAGVEALNGPQDGAEMMRQAYIRRRRVVLDALDAMDVTYALPQGGQFVFADFSFTGMTAPELSQRFLNDEHLLIFPGSSFGAAWENFMRITFLQPEDKLGEAMGRMQRAVARIMAERK
jgi:aminotransferase